MGEWLNNHLFKLSSKILFFWNSILTMLISMSNFKCLKLSSIQNFQKYLSGKICIKLDVTNIEFQNRGILLYNLKMSCLDTLYIVQKIRLNSHFFLKKKEKKKSKT